MGQFFFSFFLILQVLILYYWMSRCGIAVIEPAKLFLISFFIALLFLISHSVIRLHGGDYFSTFTLETFILVSTSFMLFALGAILGTKRSQKFSREIIYPHYRRNSFITFVLAVGSIVYIFFVLNEMLTSPVSILRGASISLLRQIANTQDVNTDVSSFALMMSLSRTSLFLFLMIVVFQPKKIGKALTVVAIVGVAVFILEGLSVGTRSAIAFGPLFLGLAGALKLYRLKRDQRGRLRGKMLRSPVRWHHLFIGIMLAYILFFAFPLSRNPNLYKNLEVFLSFAHPSEFSSWVETASEVEFLTWIKPFAYGTSYLSMGITKLSYFVENTDLSSLHSLGYYNGKVFVRFASIFEPQLYEHWLEIREIVATAMAKDGLSGNPWRTVMGDLLLDFGVIGTPVFMFFMGYSFQWWFRVLMSRREVAPMTLAGVLSAMTVVSGFFGPFANNRLAYPLVLMAVLLFFSMLVRSATHGVRMAHASEVIAQDKRSPSRSEKYKASRV